MRSTSLRSLLLAAFSAATLAACASGNSGSDGSVKHDSGSGGADLTQGGGADLSGGEDLSSTDDLSTGEDLTMTEDLSVAVDMAVPSADLAMASADLATPPAGDMAQATDSSVPTADLLMAGADLVMAPAPDLVMAPMPDLAVTPDLATPPDLLMTPDMAGLPVGTRLATAKVRILGVTNDNWIVYQDKTTKNIYGVALTGGSPVTIDSTGTGFGFVVGKTFFLWDNINNTTGIAGNFGVWQSGGTTKILANASLYGLADESSDGTRVAFAGAVTAANANGDSTFTLFGENANGTSQKALLTSQLAPVSGNTTTCYPALGFAGSHLVFIRCAANTATGTASTFDALWNKTDLNTSVYNFFSSDTVGDEVLLIDNNLTAKVYPIASATPISTIDTRVVNGFVSRDGTTVVYETLAMNQTKGTLKTSPVVNPAPTTLIPGNVVNNIDARSGDDKYLLLDENVAASGQFTDLFLASTSVAGPPTTLVSTLTSGLLGDAFTTDSSRALYLTAGNFSTAVQGTYGTLTTKPVAGGNAVNLATNVWTDLAATGTKVVFDDNLDTTNVVADLRSTDAANPAPMLLAKQADLEFFLSSDKLHVVYAISLSSAYQGLWVAAVP